MMRELDVAKTGTTSIDGWFRRAFTASTMRMQSSQE